MLALLLGFAVIHSGGASLRYWGVDRIGERAWRLLFAAVSIPSAVVVIGYFLAHRYDGRRLARSSGAAPTCSGSAAASWWPPAPA
jgi:hypothetical protein